MVVVVVVVRCLFVRGREWVTERKLTSEKGERERERLRDIEIYERDREKEWFREHE